MRHNQLRSLGHRHFALFGFQRLSRHLQQQLLQGPDRKHLAAPAAVAPVAIARALRPAAAFGAAVQPAAAFRCCRRPARAPCSRPGSATRALEHGQGPLHGVDARFRHLSPTLSAIPSPPRLSRTPTSTSAAGPLCVTNIRCSVVPPLRCLASASTHLQAASVIRTDASRALSPIASG